jgi:hypothetical protein
LPTRPEVNRLLAKGVASAKAGQRTEAYNIFLDVIELDRHNELAWLWLSTVTENPEDQRVCLENVLTINPDNTAARERLAALAANGAQRGDASPKVVICPQCGTGNRDFVRECGACGYAFFRACAICGEFNPSDAQTCSQCGSALILPDARIAQPSQQPAAAMATSDLAPIVPHHPLASRCILGWRLCFFRRWRHRCLIPICEYRAVRQRRGSKPESE